MRSRLWSLILKELPFPFRQIGMEVAQLLSWLDHTLGGAWLGMHRSPGWYFVTSAGSVTLMLTGLLFFPYIASHDPTLGQLANEGASRVRVTRASLERSGDWSAQDRWRVAHLFVDHRPPRKLTLKQLDSRLVEELPATQLLRLDHGRSTSRWASVERSARQTPISSVAYATRREPDVRLELNAPSLATQSRRLVYGPLIREPGADYDAAPRASKYRPRFDRFQVQAEWAAGADCRDEYEPRRSPLVRRGSPSIRREIPIPEPQWDEPRTTPIARTERLPNLTFETELLREYLPGTNEFPPKSHSHSVAARSEFPATLNQRRSANRSTTRATHVDNWSRSTSHVEHRPRPEPYISRLHAQGDSAFAVESSDSNGLIESDDEGSSLSSFAEVALRLELEVPQNAIAGRVHSSSLRIHNEGPTPVSRVRVHESLVELQTVTDASPDGRVHDDLLERDVTHLAPGRDQQLAMKWLPNDEGAQVHRAAVTMHAAVGVTTNIVAPEPMKNPPPRRELDPRVEQGSFEFERPRSKPPVEPEPVPEVEPARHSAISCEVKHVERITVDELVELQIFVRNMGNTPLHDVRIVASVPSELKHRRGNEVEYEVGNLAPGSTHTCVLRMSAQIPGDAVSQVQVVTREAVEAQARAVIAVVAKPIARTTPMLPEVIPRTTPKPVPKPAAKPAPFPASSGCCCQNQPVAFLGEP